MKITDLITILLIVLPGILTEKIIGYLSYSGEYKKSDFKETIFGIFWGFPVILTSGIVADKIYDFKSIKELINNFNSISFIFWFSFITIIIAVIFGVLFAFLNDKREKLINFIRTKFLGKTKTFNDAPWTMFFVPEKNPLYIEVLKDGSSYSGFVDNFSTGLEDKEIILKPPQNYWEYKDEIKECFNEDTIKRIFISFEKNIVIKDYDQKKYLDFIQKCNENNSNS